MAENDNRPLKKFVVPSELKPSLLQIVQHNQLSSNLTEGLNLHLSVFVQFVNTLKSNDIDPEIASISIFHKG